MARVCGGVLHGGFVAVWCPGFGVFGHLSWGLIAILGGFEVPECVGCTAARFPFGLPLVCACLGGRRRAWWSENWSAGWFIVGVWVCFLGWMVFSGGGCGGCRAVLSAAIALLLGFCSFVMIWAQPIGCLGFAHSDVFLYPTLCWIPLPSPLPSINLM